MTFLSGSALHGSEVLAGISNAVLAAESLAQHRLLADDGLLSWRVRRVSFNNRSRFAASKMANLLFSYPNVLVLFGVRVLLSLLLISAIVAGWPTAALLALQVFIGLLIHWRGSAGNDGSDQYTLIILIACMVAELIHTNLAATVACYFIGAQGMVAYSTSGWLKVFSAGWRDGFFVRSILSSSTFGNRTLYRYYCSIPFLATVTGLLVAVGDCALGIAALVPPPICATILLFGVFLHLGISRILGLNTFFWAFCALYPPTYFISDQLYSWVHRTL